MVLGTLPSEEEELLKSDEEELLKSDEELIDTGLLKGEILRSIVIFLIKTNYQFINLS